MVNANWMRASRKTVSSTARLLDWVAMPSGDKTTVTAGDRQRYLLAFQKWFYHFFVQRDSYFRRPPRRFCLRRPCVRNS